MHREGRPQAGGARDGPEWARWPALLNAGGAHSDRQRLRWPVPRQSSAATSITRRVRRANGNAASRTRGEAFSPFQRFTLRSRCMQEGGQTSPPPPAGRGCGMKWWQGAEARRVTRRQGTLAGFLVPRGRSETGRRPTKRTLPAAGAESSR
jgi:hypothetical protein